MEHSLSVSIVIPIGPAESIIPVGLIEDLRSIPSASEIIFVVCHQRFDDQYKQDIVATLAPFQVSWLESGQGRAVQMNYGAQAAQGEFIWFLHVDSRFSVELVESLWVNLSRAPDKLHYCLLQFLADGSNGMALNGWGANLRSRLLGIPFGDQGFAISKTLFAQVGGYPEDASYGEDHLFVWYARQRGIKLKCCTQYLQTSARKYRDKGWWYLTCRYQYLWIRQAIPELLKLLKQRYFSARCQR
ncbi:glycosyltransferase [Neptuniibacter sp. 1_MG-2023]|jgi:hypothetical protein|uniref:glycosyltransferase n=1 Tax=Neptuniibacter sp. 1_MG-2023 TaxID=3062662 RepID=UPI0026E32EE0|nr:glycosyltransferase [Neptuniibacter sp. 1_MG-2023]MDO6594259.1 glycosyltransferase [Neptuniibacter sp. 1_MG-2023]